MYQTPQPIWNEIAKTQPLKTKRWAALFKATDLPPAVEPLYRELEAAGADDRTCRAYLLVAPLLHENLAISRYVESTGRDSLRSSMMELTTVNEATILASQEFSLKPSQQAKLRKLLQMASPAPQSSNASAQPNPSR